MDYTAFYSQQYPQQGGVNVNGFGIAAPQTAQAQIPGQQGQQQNNQMAQLQQNMFYLDPFDTKLEPCPPNQLDHASFSSIFPPCKILQEC